MSICVTGGAGFIGRALCTALLANGDSVRVLSRKDNPGISGALLFQGDLTGEVASLRHFVDGVDVVYHCAGEINNPKRMHSLHVDGTKKLLDAVHASIRKTGKPVHWVQLSSVGAYGLRTGNPRNRRTITENSPHSPEGDYEVTKTISDELVLEMAAIEPLFTCTVLRPSVVIGSAMPNQSFFAMARMVKKGLFFYIGSPDAIATYVHIDDVVRALVQCGRDSRARGQIFILSNDCPMKDVIDALAESMGVAKPRISVPEMPLRVLINWLSPWLRLPLTDARIDALVKQTRYSTEHIAQVLGFKPMHSIPEIVPRLISEGSERLI